MKQDEFTERLEMSRELRQFKDVWETFYYHFILVEQAKSNKIRVHVKSETLEFATKEFPKA